MKIFFRNLLKNKTITGINLAGLTIGILSFLFILEYVYYERSFDSYHQNGNQVYRIAYNRYQNEKLLWETANSHYPSGNWLKQNYTEVEDWAVIQRNYNITVSYDNQLGSKVFYNEAKTYYATNSLFTLFTIPLVQGDKNCLENPNTVAISERSAKRYFGAENPLGKLLKVNDAEIFTVTAVYRDIPGNSHLQTEFLFSMATLLAKNPRMATNWANDYYHSYIMLAKGVDPDKFCAQALPSMVKNNYQERLEARHSRDQYYLQPLPDIHLHSNIEYETEAPGNSKIINILFGFAIFLLLVAWINYVNLVTAQSVARAREIGIKKVNGAGKFILMGQFLVEAFLFNTACLLLTLGFFFLLNPLFKTITNIQDFNLFVQHGFLHVGLSIFFSGIVASSIYPALVLSSYKPIAVLKGKFKNSAQGLVFRKGLITIQFVISIVLLAGTIISYRQASFLLKKEMGVDFNSTLVIRAPNTAENQETKNNKLLQFKNRILELPEVLGFTFTSDIPGEEINHWFTGYRKGYDTNDRKAYFQIAVDGQFVDFYDIKVLAGRKFHQHETFDQNTVLMNQMAAERFGYPDPEEAANKIIVSGQNREWTVVGVVSDFHYKSIKTEPVPTIITLNDSPKKFLTLKLDSQQAGSFASLVPKLKRTYETIYPGQPFEYFSLDDKMLLDLKPDKTFASVFTLFSILAIVIAVIGIIGLLLITIHQDMKELGIRKALGAELHDVSGLLSKQLGRQFLVAVILALPLSYFGYKHFFLNNYIYQVNITVGYFATPVLLMALIIFIVTVLLSAKVFRMKLTEVLQYE